MSDFFNFENRDLDFPFYNGKPLMPMTGWIILVLAIIVYVGLVFGAFNFIPGFEGSILSDVIPPLVLILAACYCFRGNLGSIFRKPEFKDLKVIILCFIIYIIFSAAMNILLGSLGLVNRSAASNSASPLGQTILSAAIIYFGLIGEELFKVTILLLFMAIMYGFTKDRKNSVIVGTIVCCILFGLLHLRVYGFNLIVCLLVGGVGCLIHLYPYLKTKNIVNSYLTHILIDTLAVVLPMLMAAMH